MMSKSNLIGPWIRRFLVKHLVTDRNLSINTRSSYRDTLALLMQFSTRHTGILVDKITTDHVTSELIYLFLRYLEEERKCTVATRNQRLAAIHALSRFVGSCSPEHVSWCIDICSVPFKKAAKPVMNYLEKDEMDALLNTPNRNSRLGKRDYALLLFLYNTGARASEAAGLRIIDLQLEQIPLVKIIGKGNKIRYCPLWNLTAKILLSLIDGRSKNENVFLNRRNQPITRFGIHNVIKRHKKKAEDEAPSLCSKQITVHSIRHSTAVHLLRAGVDINTIRSWLGHVSLNTTNIYAEVDLQMKARALSHCEILTPVLDSADWKSNSDLLTFLKSL